MALPDKVFTAFLKRLWFGIMRQKIVKNTKRKIIKAFAVGEKYSHVTLPGTMYFERHLRS